jgi:outer membrane usher protein
MALIATGAGELRATAPERLEPAWLEVWLNGQPLAEPARVLTGPDGAFYIAADLLRAWRLRLDGLPAIDVDGTNYVPLAAVRGLVARLDPETQILRLDVDPALIERTSISGRRPAAAPMTESGRGGFLNYEFVAEHSAGRASAGAAIELGVFIPGGFGTSSFVGRWADGAFGLTRLETRWVIDDPRRMRSLRLGDGISGGGVGGGPLRFGGVQLSRNFAAQPGFVTIPLPGLDGSAALPSVVDVYVNDVLEGRHQVPAGPFSITDVPVVTGGGEVQMVVRDLLGRETILRQDYYASPQLLRPGLSDYSYEIGFLRRGFGRASNDYGPLFVSGTHRHGLTRNLTAEVHAEASANVQAGGVQAAILWPDVALVTAGAAASRSDAGTGAMVRVGVERRTASLSYGAVAEFVSDDYVTLGTEGQRAPPPALTVQAFAGMPLPFGSAGISYTFRDGRGAEPDVEFLGANATVRLGSYATLSLAARRSFRPRAETALQLFLTMPMGARTHASAGLNLRAGDLAATAALERHLPAGPGFGYRIGGRLGEHGRLDGRLAFQTEFGAYDAQLTWSESGLGARFTTSGSIGAVEGRVFTARRMSQSFATVDVGDFENVRVYADNQLVGRTGADGVAIVPRLRPFEDNQIRIEIADLPIDAEIETAERVVRPYDRSGVAVDFGARRSRNAIVSVRLDNGAPLPAGSLVAVDSRDESFVSAPGGDVFLAGLADRNLVVARGPGGDCRFELVMPGGDDPQPRLGPFTCRRVVQ